MQIQKAIERSLREDGDEEEEDMGHSPSPEIVSPDSSPQLLASDADKELELAIRLSQREFESQRKRQLKEDEMLERAIALSMNQK